MKFLIFTLLMIACTSLVMSKDRNSKPYKVVCYYESWNNQFSPESINPNVCTHVIYSFAKLTNNTIELTDPKTDDGEVNDASKGKGLIRRMNELRKANPHLTTMISLGGWSEGSTKYSEMVRNAENRKTFVGSVLKFLQRFDLDGIDLDWEYPSFDAIDSGNRVPGRDADKGDFGLLLKELQEAFKPHGYILSAAIATGRYVFERAYDIPTLNKYLDFANLMLYDMHGAWEKVTGHNAPLYYAQNSTGANRELTAQFAVEYFIEHGMESNKIVFGIPIYAGSFKLAGPDHKVGAPIAGAGNEGGAYSKTCDEHLVKNGWQLFWDNVAQVPYAVKGSAWLTYENLKSIHKKLDYVLEKKLGGSMVWAVDGDDFEGKCGKGKFPMMKAQMKTLNKVDVADFNLPVPSAHQHNH